MNDDGLFSLAVYNASCDASNVKIEKNPIFKSAEIEKNEEKKWVKILLKPYSVDNFYGFEYYYTDGYTVVEFRNPQTLAEGDLPLLGKTIVVDAGHGGSETGANTPLSRYYEKALNLSISQALCEKLKALGANVHMIRTEDVTVPIADRLSFLMELEPDLCVSIHHNSMTLDTDITTIRGLLGLYFADSGRLLAKCISSSAADELNLYERSAAKQRLAMVRNPKFPSMLLEVGFLTNVEEFEMLSSAIGIDRAAEGVAKGIIEYYKVQSEFIR
jgi:N-acetylmuramoyl-L-alanine amidase